MVPSINAQEVERVERTEKEIIPARLYKLFSQKAKSSEIEEGSIRSRYVLFKWVRRSIGSFLLNL